MPRSPAVHCIKLCLTNLCEADALFRIFQGFVARWPNLCVSLATQETPRNCILKSWGIWHGLKYISHFRIQICSWKTTQWNTAVHCVDEFWNPEMLKNKLWWHGQWSRHVDRPLFCIQPTYNQQPTTTSSSYKHPVDNNFVNALLATVGCFAYCLPSEKT